MHDTDQGWEIMNYFKKCLNQYTDFYTRARRSEYWYFVLYNAIFSFIISFVLGFIAGLIGWDWIGYLIYIYAAFLFLPSWAVAFRRMHDIGKSGWWALVALIPVIGTIWFIVLACQDSQPGANQWGENPKGL